MVKRVFLCALVAASAAFVPAADLVERVVVRVNDSVITQSDLNDRVERVRKDPATRGDTKALTTAVLEQMIQQKLIEEKAAKLEITVADAEIGEAVDRVKAQYGLSKDEDFDRALATNGLTRDGLRDQMKNEILTNKVLSREVPVNLTDDALRTEYEKVKDKIYAVPERVKMAQIVVRFSSVDAESKNAALAKISDSATRIKGGAPFAEVARTVSEGPARDRGGDLGWVSRGELTPELDQAIFSGGDLSQPVESRDAYYLFSVTERQKASFKSFDDVKEEIRKKMSEDIYDKKFAEYLRDLRKTSFVKIFDTDLGAADADWLKQREKAAS